MSDARKLHEKRANLLTEAQSIVTDLAEKGEALEGESQARFEKLTSEAATVAAAIRSEKEATEARSAADAVRAEYATAIAPKVEKTEGSNDELRALARNGGVQVFEYRDVTRSTGLGNPVTIADPDYGDITDLMNGRDLTVEHIAAEKEGAFPSYTVRVKPNQTPATTDKEVASKIVNEQKQITELYGELSYEEMTAALEKWLNPDTNAEAPAPEGESQIKSAATATRCKA